MPELRPRPEPQESNVEKVRWATAVLLEQYDWLATQIQLGQADIANLRTTLYHVNAVLFGVADELEATVPIPMLIWCPECGERHIDGDTIAPHALHACQNCGFAWRHAIERTVGVRFLPGFRDPGSPSRDQLRLRR